MCSTRGSLFGFAVMEASLQCLRLPALRRVLSVLFAFALLPLSAMPAAGQCEVQKLTPTPAGFDVRGFGTSVSVDGDVAIVGGPTSGGGCGPGEAQVYRWNGAIWIEEQKPPPRTGRLTTSSAGPSR